MFAIEPVRRQTCRHAPVLVGQMGHFEGVGEIGDPDGVEIATAVWHSGHRLRPLWSLADKQAAVRRHLGMEAGRYLQGLTVPEVEVLPAVAGQAVVHHVRRHHGEITPDRVEHHGLHLGEHLKQIKDSRGTALQAEGLFQCVVGPGRRAGHSRGPQINGRAIGLLVIQNLAHAFPRIHAVLFPAKSMVGP